MKSTLPIISQADPQLDVEKISQKFFLGFNQKIEALTTPNFFLNPNFFFAYCLGLMHVTESLPAKIWGYRPIGLGGVVVSASLLLC
jgi:hypothetical protein